MENISGYENHLFYKNKDLNLLSIYLEQISKYKLLTKEEELKLGKDLLLIKNIDPFFIKKDKKSYKYTLNYENILVSLNLYKWMNYEIVIETIIDYLSKQDNENDKSSLNLLKKYRDISKKLNRALNDEELNEYFRITYDKNKWGYISSEILRNIELFIIYSEAFDTLYKSNLKFVVSIAKLFNTSINILDLISEGNIGLMRAIERFDITRGYKFSTYARWWIKNEINNCIYDNRFNIRLPRNFYDQITAFYTKVKDLENKYCRKLSNIEISKELNLPLNKIIDYIKYSQETISIESKIGDEKDTELIDYIQDDNNIDDNCFNNEIKKDINILFSTLTDKELKIIKLRNGLTNKGEIYTLQNIADHYGVTRERIRQIENRAMKKMIVLSKNNSKCKELKEYIK